MQGFFEDILIRLTEDGFVETITYQGRVVSSSVYETGKAEPAREGARGAELLFARVHARFGEKRRYTD